MKPSETIQKFIDVVNAKVPKNHWEQEDQHLEFEALAEIGQLIFDDDRIRSCLFCGPLFYARQANMFCCSRKHSTAIRARSFRDKWQSKLEEVMDE